MKTTTCKKCGQPDLIWAKSKKGNWYLGEDVSLVGEYRPVKARFIQAHDCEGYAKNDEAEMRAFLRPIVSNEVFAAYQAKIDSGECELSTEGFTAAQVEAEAELERRMEQYLANRKAK